MIAKEKLNILWSLEQTAEKYADRVAVSDVNQELTWKELVKKAQIIGAELSEKVQPGNPVPVLLEKSSETLAVMLGIVYAGCFYVPVNPMNPTERLRKIMEKLDPEVIVSRANRRYRQPQTAGAIHTAFHPPLQKPAEFHHQPLLSPSEGLMHTYHRHP